MWKKILIWVLMLVFALLVIPLTFLLGLYNTVFDKSFYTEDLAGFAYSFVTENLPPLENSGSGLGNISAEDLQQVFKKVFTKEDFSGFLGAAFMAVETDLAHVNNGNVTLHIPLDIFKGKQLVFASAMTDLLYARIPVCADKVIPKDFECLPKGFPKPDFTSKVMSSLDRSLFSKIPNTFDVEVQVPNFFGEDVWSFVHNAFLEISAVVFLVALFLLGMIALLVKKPCSLVLKAVAKTLMLPAFLLLIFVAGLYFFPILVKLPTSGVDATSYLLINFLSLFFRAFSFNLLCYVVPVFVLASVMMFLSLRKKYESQ